MFFFLNLLRSIKKVPIMSGISPSFRINDILVKPYLSPKIPIPPVNKTFMKPNIEIKLIFLRLYKSKKKYVKGKSNAIRKVKA